MALRGETHSRRDPNGSPANLERLRSWYEGGDSERLLTFFEHRTAAQSPQALFFRAAALLERGREREARNAICEGLDLTTTDDLKADFLALDAFTEATRGDFAGYLEGARKAVRLGRTPLTLYHLGLAADDAEEGLAALRAALADAESRRDTYAAVRNAATLSVPLLRLGRYQEARHWLFFGEQRCRHEGLRMALLHTRAYLQTLLGETEGLEAELRAVLEEWLGLYPWLEEPVSSALADLLQAEGRWEEALAIQDWLLTAVPRGVWPRVALGAVRALVALQRQEEAVHLAKTAVTVSGEWLPGRGVAELALGIALWPAPTAEPHLRSALAVLSGAVPMATEAALHLAPIYERAGDGLRAEEVVSPLRPSMQQLGASGLVLLGGRALGAVEHLLTQPPRFEARLLVQAVVLSNGHPVDVRPRGLEILAILLARPEGTTRENLSDAVYGRNAAEALRVELHRLKRSAGIEIRRSPYRLATEIDSDIQAVEASLRRGDVREAAERYGGPLLPWSRSPGVVMLREALETQVVEAVLTSGDLEAAWTLAQAIEDDLRLWEALLRLPSGDHRRYAAEGRVASLRKEFGL